VQSRRQQGPGHGRRDEAPRLRRLPASHGTHEYFRHGGSIGNRSYPGRVLKGKRMSGRLAPSASRRRNLAVVAVRADEHCCWSAAPCRARNGTVMVRQHGRSAR
jgi:large subunit ribosomal protein L3